MDARSSIKSRLPSRRVTEQPEGAAMVAAGCSIDVAPNLPATAHECGTDVTLFDVTGVFKKTSYIAGLKPGGRDVAKDMFDVGGIPLLIKTLPDHGFLHGECMTVMGRTIAEKLKSVWNPDQDVYPAGNAEKISYADA